MSYFLSGKNCATPWLSAMKSKWSPRTSRGQTFLYSNFFAKLETSKAEPSVLTANSSRWWIKCVLPQNFSGVAVSRPRTPAANDLKSGCAFDSIFFGFAGTEACDCSETPRAFILARFGTARGLQEKVLIPILSSKFHVCCERVCQHDDGLQFFLQLGAFDLHFIGGQSKISKRYPHASNR